MGRDLTNLNIKDTYEGLVQISGSQLTDGTGSLIPSLEATASFATSASQAENANTAVSASHALVADLATQATDATYAQNTITTGKNLEATQIDKGTPVYFTGSGTSGNLVGILRADAGNPARMPAGGIAGEDITAGAEGRILLDGYIGGVDTSLFASGDEVFVAVGGGYTNEAPTGSALIQHLGNVEKSAINGSGVIQMMGEARGLPNIQDGYVWLGDANGVPQAVASSSLVVDSAVSASHAVQADNADTATSASYATTASYAENSIPPFPYTGSAEISGSLGITGSFAVISGSVVLNDENTTYGQGTRNLLVGEGAGGNGITTAQENTIIGPSNAFGSAGEALTSGTKNVVVGAGNAKGLTTGDRNVLVGHGQIQGTSFTGDDNVYIGDATARDITSGNQNVRIGRWAGYNANGTNNAISIGTRSGWKDVGNYNIIIGDNVVGQTSSNFTGSNFLVLGSDVNATDNLLYGYHGTAQGRFLNVSGSIIIGSGSAYLEFPDGTKQYTAGGGGGGGTAGLISGSGVNSLTSANYTTTDAIADDSGSIAIGDNAQATGSGTINSVVIGKDANSKENAPRNVVIGYNAQLTEANRNDSVLIGANASGYQEGVAVGANSFTIYQAVAVGKDAYTNDNYGVAVGAGARTNNNGGIAIGSGSLQDGDGSIAIGKGAHATATGDIVVNNSYADIISYSSASQETTFLGNVESNGYTRTSGSFSGSVIDNITDIYTTSPAVEHIVSLTQAEYDAIGTPDANTLYQITDAPASLITASASGSVITFTKEDSTTFDVAITASGGGSAFPFVGDAEITGSLAVEGWTKSEFFGPSGSDGASMFIGKDTGINITSGVRNTTIGSYYGSNPSANLYVAGYQITSGNDNTFIGAGAGTRLTTGTNNTAIGMLALGGTTSGTDNVALGGQALRDNNGTANIGIGKWAGYNASGQNGVQIGHRTGFGNSGWRNIILGANAVGQGGSLTTHDKLVIGQDLTPTDNLIYGYHGPDTTAGDRFLQVKGLINAGQYASAPTGAGVQAGSIYYDTTLNKLRCYDGTSWNNLF